MERMDYASSFGRRYGGRNVTEAEDVLGFAERLSRTAARLGSVDVSSRVEQLNKKGHSDLSYRVIFSFTKGLNVQNATVSTNLVEYTRLFNGEVKGDFGEYLARYLKGIGEDVLEFNPELDVSVDTGRGALRVSRRTH